MKTKFIDTGSFVVVNSCLKDLTIMSSHKFSKKQLDVLKEIGNICAGNASVALTQILFKKIELQIPKVKIISMSEVSQAFKDVSPIICIQMEILGALHGSALLIFEQECAYTIMELLVGKTGDRTKLVTQIGISSLKEIGNIVISSYLSTLSSLSRLPVFPSCPQFSDGLATTVIKNVFGGVLNADAYLILIETVFTEQVTAVSGTFFIAIDSDSMRLILDACEKNIPS